MANADQAITGGCQCGAVRYRLSSTPKAPSICHCRMCQKAGGAPFMAFGGVPLRNVSWTRGSPKIFKSSDFAERGFCAECGTPLTYQAHSMTQVSFTLGSLDHPAAVPPVDQLGIEARLPWVETISSLPSFRTSDWLDKHHVVISNNQHPDADS